MESLAGLQDHPLASKYPCRTPVWWARVGDVHKDPSLRGVSGRMIVLRIPKQFGRIEGWFAKVLRAPKEIRRPLDQMNSLLWELCDGSRTFGEICQVMDEVFHEHIAPVIQRTAAAIGLFQSRNLALMLDEPLNGRWTVGPGKTPDHQSLTPSPPEHGYDAEPLDGEAP
ncbi:MAG: hypothetical protein ACPGSA_00240 [Poseidonia sp.]